MRQAIVQVVVAGLAGCALWGCAPLTEQERYEWFDRVNTAKEEFHAREEVCESRGGVMHMRTRPLEKPRYLDYKSATCVRR